MTRTIPAGLVLCLALVLAVVPGAPWPGGGPPPGAAWADDDGDDGGARIWRRAQRGPHVTLAAPGVDVWTAASVSGGRPQTGTSFAAPFVTAAAYLARMRGLAPAAVPAALAAAARDLGPPGRDDTYGHGLLDAAGLCAPPGG